MAYLEKVIDRGNVIEIQKYINGRYGVKEKRKKAAAQRTTPEEQLRWQSKEAMRKVWRLLRDKENFSPGDLWVTLTYPRKSTPDSETVKKNIKEFLKRIRRKYKQAGKECKYIFSVGRGKRGAIHLHMVLTKIDTEILATAWQNIVNHGDWAHVHIEHLDRSQNWQQVAAYLIKNGEETFLSDDPIIKKRFSASRNLREAKPKGTGEIVTEAVKINVRALPKKGDLGSFKPADHTDTKSTLELIYFKETINGRRQIEIDKLNYIHYVNGTDYLKGVREALGL